MPKQTILAIEDDEDILELIRYNLLKEGFDFTGAISGEDGLRRAKANPPDLIILDLMLPGIDGFEVCRQLRGDSKTAHVPLIMLTARGEEADIVAGLELGADDYITKPFSPRILIARVRAILRRKAKTNFDPDTPIKIDDLIIHPGRHEVSIKGKRLELTLSEFRLLHFLAGRPGWVFTRYQIVNAIKGEDYPVTDRSIDVQVVGLRKKLGSYAKYIETVRGVGYRFKEL